MIGWGWFVSDIPSSNSKTLHDQLRRQDATLRCGDPLLIRASSRSIANSAIGCLRITSPMVAMGEISAQKAVWVNSFLNFNTRE
jgi:hypothetical protein